MLSISFSFTLTSNKWPCSVDSTLWISPIQAFLFLLTLTTSVQAITLLCTGMSAPLLDQTVLHAAATGIFSENKSRYFSLLLKNLQRLSALHSWKGQTLFRPYVTCPWISLLLFLSPLHSHVLCPRHTEALLLPPMCHASLRIQVLALALSSAQNTFCSPSPLPFTWLVHGLSSEFSPLKIFSCTPLSHSVPHNAPIASVLAQLEALTTFYI